MRLATVVADGKPSVAVLRDKQVLPLTLPDTGFGSLRAIAGSGAEGLRRVRDWADRQPAGAYRSIDDVELAPAVPDPGAIYTVGLNYAEAGELDRKRPQRPLIYAKLPTSVSGHGAVVTWDRSLTPNVDAEAELGVVIGEPVTNVSPEDAMGHVFGYTCINDMASRDPWLDGDQWLLGKSLPGFCPVGPWVVTHDEIDPRALRLGCTINGVPIQDGHTDGMLFSIGEVIAYLSRHTVLRPGDLIATGTPARLAGPLGPDRRLQAGDVVTVWIEQIGELTTTIA
jgi:2-keto-4-pentenoate hydratase/2-oxohepta-3-ene-1,7-dioic acid hydratase in catechol pathway